MTPESRSRHALSSLIAVCEQVRSGNPGQRATLPGGGGEFDELARSLNRMLDWFCTLLDTAREANNAMAHHMRTPLSALRLDMSALAGEAALPASLRTRIERQVRQVDALVAMFDRVLLIAKAESGAGSEVFEAFDLGELVPGVAELFRPVLEEKGMQLCLSVPEQPLEFLGERQLILQALANLLDNACKYSHEKDVVTIALDAGQEYVRLTVSDHGPGIGPGLRETVRRRFTRGGGQGDGQGSGFGLGLSLADAAAALHQGSLDLADNAPGLSASLRLRRLPN